MTDIGEQPFSKYFCSQSLRKHLKIIHIFYRWSISRHVSRPSILLRVLTKYFQMCTNNFYPQKYFELIMCKNIDHAKSFRTVQWVELWEEIVLWFCSAFTSTFLDRINQQQKIGGVACFPWTSWLLHLQQE